MPYRGRDTVYVESLIAFCNLACGLICILVRPPRFERTVLSLMDGLAPVALWATMWIAAGVALLHGWRYRRLKYIEYGAMSSTALWLMVAVNAWRDAVHYPMTCALAPIFAAYSALIFFYQAKVNSGRFTEPRR